VVFGTGEQRPGIDVDIERLAKIVFLDAASGALRKSIDGVHVDKPTALAISRDGRWIATGTSTGVVDQRVNHKTGLVSTVENKDPIRVWDISTGKLVSELPVSSRIWGIAFTADGRHLIATRSDIQQHMTMGVWESSSGRPVQDLKVWPAPMGIALSPDGSRLAATGNGQLSIFQVTTKK
jgi:WD40 repeat protein